MKKRIFITGVSGFVGSHLLDLLSAREASFDLYGIVRERSSIDKINHRLNSIRLVSCDLINLANIAAIFREVKPDHVYHLAGESSVKLSWGGTLSMVNSNIVGTLNVLEAIRATGCKDTKILLPCSSEEYGLVSEGDIPIKEETPLKPVSPYAVSKATVDMFGFQYYVSYGLQAIRIRAFNHTGPRRPDTYALSGFAKQLAEIEKGLKAPVIRVGNLNAVRDYTDVRDMVKAYELAMEHCKPGEVYNVCSSRGYKIGDLLEMLIRLAKCKVDIVPDEKRSRPVDLPLVVGDNSKFTGTTMWRPEIPIAETLQDMLDYWRAEVR